VPPGGQESSFRSLMTSSGIARGVAVVPAMSRARRGVRFFMMEIVFWISSPRRIFYSVEEDAWTRVTTSTGGYVLPYMLSDEVLALRLPFNTIA